MSAPFLDNIKAMDTKLQETKPKDLKAQDNKSKDDNAEKKNASDLESVDRFDTQNLLSALLGVTSGTVNSNPWTNTQQNEIW